MQKVIGSNPMLAIMGGNMKTKILVCKNCKPHDFQDKKYGVRKRVHNLSGDKNKNKARCTVCGNVREV